MSSDKNFKNLTEREKYLCQVSIAIGLMIGLMIMGLSFMIIGGACNI